MTLNHMKRCSVSLIREIQLKTILLYHFHLSYWQKSKRYDYILCWQGYRGNKYSHIYMTVTTSMKGNLTVSIKIISAVFSDLPIPLPGIYPTDTSAYVQNDVCRRLLMKHFYKGKN